MMYMILAIFVGLVYLAGGTVLVSVATQSGKFWQMMVFLLIGMFLQVVGAVVLVGVIL